MVNIENHIGKITVSKKYLTELVKHTVSDCFGVSDVCESNPVKSLAYELTGGRICGCHNGVRISYDKKSGLSISLNIKVLYGINISAAVKSITHKVSFCVEEATGIPVSQVKVFVDELKN